MENPLKKIIHIDMDAFYASVEQRDFPEYRGKPLAVGGSRQRGVVAAASYEARKYGVFSAMPSVTAFRKCPGIIFVKPRFEVYKAVSREIMEILRSYTDLVEPLSLDEAYLDVTVNKFAMPYATIIAREIKAKIKETTGLNASAGVSFNKFLAKIFPDYFEEYRDYIPENERDSLIKAYYRRLTSPDRETRVEAGRRFSAWETRISKLIHEETDKPFTASERDIANSAIECLYTMEYCFFPENYLIDHLEAVLEIPTYIVHGRYDIVCSVSNAWDLLNAWRTKSGGRFQPELVITPSSGHSQMEAENISVLVGFMDKIRDQLQKGLPLK